MTTEETYKEMRNKMTKEEKINSDVVRVSAILYWAVSALESLQEHCPEEVIFRLRNALKNIEFRSHRVAETADLIYEERLKAGEVEAQEIVYRPGEEERHADMVHRALAGVGEFSD